MLGIVLAVFIAGLGGYTTLTYHAARVSASTPSSIPDKEAYWFDMVQRLGPDVAHAELRRQTDGLSRTEQHTESHVFGAALYKAGGSLRTCGEGVESVEYVSAGCFHEVVGRFIVDHGLSAIETLLEECGAVVQTNLLCRHSVGHGILSSVGYEPEDIPSAIPGCRNDTLREFCLAGIFMEHNYHRLSDGILRQPDNGNFREPCDTLRGEQRNICILWQSKWWSTFERQNGGTQANVSSILPMLQNRCAIWDNSQERRLCIAGIGIAMFYFSDTDSERAGKLCHEHMGSDESACAMGAAFRFSMSSGLYGKPEAACALLKESDQRTCAQVAKSTNVLTELVAK